MRFWGRSSRALSPPMPLPAGVAFAICGRAARPSRRAARPSRVPPRPCLRGRSGTPGSSDDASRHLRQVWSASPSGSMARRNCFGTSCGAAFRWRHPVIWREGEGAGEVGGPSSGRGSCPSRAVARLRGIERAVLPWFAAVSRGGNQRCRRLRRLRQRDLPRWDGYNLRRKGFAVLPKVICFGPRRWGLVFGVDGRLCEGFLKAISPGLPIRMPSPRRDRTRARGLLFKAAPMAI